MKFRSSALGPVLFASLGLSLASGCNAPSEPSPGAGELTVTRGDAIKGGYTDKVDSAVVGIYDGYVGGLCSGTLIAPNLVLTARHCVSTVLNESSQGGVLCGQTTFGAAHKAKYFSVTTRPTFTQSASDYHGVAEIVLLPVDSKFCGNDQAILILDENIDPSEAVPMVPRVDVPLNAGEEYYAVGYGATDDAGSGSGVRRRRDSLFIDCVSDTCPSGYVKDTEWIGDQGICQGDSGGPALDLQNRVVGVTSRGALGCLDPVYGYVFGWAQWLKDTSLYAASVGGYAPMPWSTGWPTDVQYSAPIGDVCGLPEDCISNRCLNDGVAQYCTRLCSAQAPCPEGWFCDEAGTGVCFQTHPEPEPAPTKKTTKAAAAPGETITCAMGSGTSDDPTKPIPWVTGAGVLAALAAFRRRQRP